MDEGGVGAAGRVGDSLGAVDRGSVFLPSLPTAVQGIALLMPRSAAADQRDVLEGTHAGQVGLVHSTGPPCSGPTDFQKQATGSPASLRLRAQSETARPTELKPMDFATSSRFAARPVNLGARGCSHSASLRVGQSK